MNNYLIVAISYTIGVLGYSCYRIRDISIEFPNEASQVKLWSTFWRREFISFLLATFVGISLVFTLPDWIDGKIGSLVIRNNLRWIPLAIGTVFQGAALTFFGVSKTLIYTINKKAEAILAVNRAATTGDAQTVVNDLAAESPRPLAVADLVQKSAQHTPIVPEVK